MADVYARLSILLWDWEGYLKAWEVCQEGLELMVGASDSIGYSRLLAEAGRIAYLVNLTCEVRSLCQQASEMAAHIGELEVVADATITLALVEEDIPRAITEMERVLSLTEEHGLLRSAARAHINLGDLMERYLIDLQSSAQHSIQAIEIIRQIGDIMLLGIPLANACFTLIWMGQLNRAKQMIERIFLDSRLSRDEYYSKIFDARLFFAQGEWKKSLEVNKILREKIPQGTFLQSIASRNYEMTIAILELCRFGSHGYLTEAENALKENIEIGGYLQSESKFLLVEVFICQNRMSDAHDQFTQAQGELSTAAKDNNLFRELCANANLLIALAEHQWNNAVEASETSIEIYKYCHHHWGWARKMIDLGDALVGRDEPGDLERARETYQQSLDMFTEMGAPGYIKVLEERLGNL